MPLDEEGAKWSCEPCIRGHRSSKCQHFDRLMMKVPKAGRPLAKCPHPKGTCSCKKTYAVMVRIPKGPTCMCRPLYEVPVENDDQPSTPASTAPVTIAPAVASNSVAPTPTPVSGKVQKPGRKQSNIQAAPENIARALESISKVEKEHPENGVSNGLPSYTSHNQGLLATYAPLGQQPPDLISYRAFGSGGTATPKTSNCCSGKAHTQHSPEPEPQRQGSCCGKQEPQLERDTRAKSGLSDNGNGHSSSVNAMSHTPFSAPSFSSWQDFQVSGHDNLPQSFPVHPPLAQSPAYFPPYAAPHSTMGFPYQSMPHSIGFTQAPMPTFSAAQPRDFPYKPPTAIEDDSGHVCECGDGCQCLGCASHPFNQTTKQHVQEMGLLVGLNGAEPNQHSPYSMDAVPTPLDYSVGMNNNLDGALQPMHPYSEQTPYPHHMGGGYPSHANYASEQELMEPSQYHTLEYSVGLPTPCSDVTGSCQCGNDCSCIGCLTHSGHDNLGFEPVSMENTNGFHTSEPSVQKMSPDVSKDFSAPSPSL